MIRATDQVVETSSNLPASLQLVDSWSQFWGGVLISSAGGAIFAYALSRNLGLLRQLI